VSECIIAISSSVSVTGCLFLGIRQGFLTVSSIKMVDSGK
jgi:hypothetical protein